MTEIYLDNSASSQPLPVVVDAIARTMASHFGNPSSQHGRGRAARAAVDNARAQVADFFSVSPDQVVFTSGATEANDAVLRWAFSDPECQLITTRAEHPSLRGVFQQAPERIVELPLNCDGIVDQELAARALSDEGPGLLAISWVNSETGVAQPIHDLCAAARAASKRTLIDATQAAGRLPSEVFEFDYDYLTVSAHKMNGPQGVGCLILNPYTPCPAMAAGGGQEDGRRSGTENLPGIVGFGIACHERAATLVADLVRMAGLRDLLEQRLTERLPRLRVNGRHAPRSVTNTSITFQGVDGIALVARLDAAGVRCSQTSACSSGRPEPSRTLLAMGLDEEDAFATVRFSVSVLSKVSEIEAAAEIVAREVHTLRSLMGELA